MNSGCLIDEITLVLSARHLCIPRQSGGQHLPSIVATACCPTPVESHPTRRRIDREHRGALHRMPLYTTSHSVDASDEMSAGCS